MNYDKESFLAGIAVGRQLKGWGQSAGANRCPRAAAETVFDFAGMLDRGELGWTVTATEEQ